jgi:hypothetical protein
MANQGAAPDRPTREDLAGANVLVEGPEDLTVRPGRGPRPEEGAPNGRPPTREALAGEYLLVEAEEKVTVPAPPPEQAP